MAHQRQELVRSQLAIVQCGDRTVDWTDVAAISHWLKVWIPALDEKSRRWRRFHGQWGNMNNYSGAYSGEDLEYFRQTLHVKGRLEFETMLIHARNCNSSDPRDKVYSILGLTGDTANDILLLTTLYQSVRSQFKRSESKHLRASHLMRSFGVKIPADKNGYHLGHQTSARPSFHNRLG